MKKPTKAQIREVIQFWKARLNESEEEPTTTTEEPKEEHKDDAPKGRKGRGPAKNFVVCVMVNDTANYGKAPTGESDVTEQRKKFGTAEEANEFLRQSIKDAKEKYKIQESRIKRDDDGAGDITGAIEAYGKGQVVKDMKIFKASRSYLADPKDPMSIECVDITWWMYRLEKKAEEVDPDYNPAAGNGRKEGEKVGRYDFDDEKNAEMAKKDFEAYLNMTPDELKKAYDQPDAFVDRVTRKLKKDQDDEEKED